MEFVLKARFQQRRGFTLIELMVVVAIISLLMAIMLPGLRSARQPPRLERVELALERWPRELDGFRVVQVSDTHIGPILGRSFAEHVVAQVNALDADLVAAER